MNAFDFRFPRTKVISRDGKIRVAMLNSASGAIMGLWGEPFRTREEAKAAIAEKRAAVKRNRAHLGGTGPRPWIVTTRDKS